MEGVCARWISVLGVQVLSNSVLLALERKHVKHLSQLFVHAILLVRILLSRHLDSSSAWHNGSNWRRGHLFEMWMPHQHAHLLRRNLGQHKLKGQDPVLQQFTRVCCQLVRRCVESRSYLLILHLT